MTKSRDGQSDGRSPAGHSPAGPLRPAVWAGGVALLIVGPAAMAQADDHSDTGFYNTFGVSGLVDMPSARAAPDAEIATTFMHSGETTRITSSFQVLPRISGSFRYSIIEDYLGPGADLYDHSFDLRFTLVEERNGWPEITVGLQDFIGTGVYGAEYIVATRRLSPNFEISGGLGWGRLASRNGFDNPLGLVSDRFDTRPPPKRGGGRLNVDTWFRGEAALFGGLSWRPTDRLTLRAEYSSDAYLVESAAGRVDGDTPINVALTYRLIPGLDVTASLLHGNQLGFGITGTFNPKTPPLGATPDPVPPPVVPRSAVPLLLEAETGAPAGAPFEPSLRRALDAEGLALEGLRVDGSSATVSVRNQRYRSQAQAVGRTARVMSGRIPAEIDRFVIVLVEHGMPLTAVELRRQDLEELEYAPDGAWQSYVRATIGDARSGEYPATTLEPRPRFDFSLGPYLDTEIFDPDAPLRADVGLRARGSYAITQGLYLSGSVRKKAFGTLDQSTRPSDSTLTRVRSENAIYNREGDPAVEHLLLEGFFRPAPDLFGRISTGYLEKMYGGVDGELLWKPQESRFALGAEIAYARQRDFDQLFGFRDYDTVTGHVSGYYDLGDGFHARLDAGRYLAEDWGATLEITREFDNGIRIGAFATLTDVGFDDFGEGSFDKGIRISIPLTWVTGWQTRDEFTTIVRPVLRDGGARVDVPNRLYDVVRPFQARALAEEWPRFWR